jgi:hypothetical protein
MRERGDEDGRGIIAVAERSGIEPWRDQFYNEHSDTLVFCYPFERGFAGCFYIHKLPGLCVAFNPVASRGFGL